MWVDKDGNLYVGDCIPGDRAATSAEITAWFTPKPSEVRAKRNQLLRESDWAMLDDAGTDKAAWKAYRKDLRDIPQQPGFPAAVIWPQQPAQ